MALAAIEEIGLVGHLDRCDRHALARQRLAPLLGLGVKNAIRLDNFHIFERRVQGLYKIMAHIGEHAAERRGDARIARHDDMRHAELARDRGRMHRTSAAKREQREFTRVVSLVDRDQPGCAGHLVIDHADDRRCRLGRIEPKGFTYLLGNGAPHRIGAEAGIEARDCIRVDPP